MKKYTLPISENYVKHWGLWEAVREILQNALDQKHRHPDSKMFWTYDEQQGCMIVKNDQGCLSKSSLVLGNTDKEDKNLRGQFGEGYKLALLVLTRLGHAVDVSQGHELWTPAIEHDHDFDTKVLNVYVHEAVDFMNGIEFKIGMSKEQYEAISEKIWTASPEDDQIIHGEKWKGTVFVGGLFVCHNKGLKYGYNFGPAVKLDRDRSMLDGFNLYYKTSELWSKTLDVSNLSAMMMDRVSDVQYVNLYSHYGSTLPSTLLTHFQMTYPDALPVVSQEEVEKAQAAGKKWVLVPEQVKSILSRVWKFFIPTSGTPLERLKKLRWKIIISDEDAQEFDDILAVLENKR